VDAVPRLTTFARGYMHLFEMHTTSPRPKICPLLPTTSQALFDQTFMHAIVHSLRADCDGLEEVGSISTEMHVTPAERSEPGGMQPPPPSRSRASKRSGYRTPRPSEASPGAYGEFSQPLRGWRLATLSRIFEARERGHWERAYPRLALLLRRFVRA